MAERPLDIFKVLEQVDTKQHDAFSNFTDVEKKGYAPLVVQRWLTGTYNKTQIILINELLNPYVFSLQQHKELLWKLTTVCTSGTKQRYVWNKTLTDSSTNSECIKCIKQYFNYNTKHAKIVYNTIDKLLVIDMAEELGYTDSDINKIRKELGLVIPKKSKSKKDAQSLNGIEF